ncbi:MAG: hypothetical protein GTO03_18295, partial [Planctomycetales bacterium]|nr:hypothetical protein [Planctomycetales bacterium]
MNNLDSDPTLTNVTFYGNSALDGGGMNNEASSPALTNVTFYGNSAEVEGGGMYNAGSDPVLANCILWGNTASQGAQIHNSNSAPVIGYSLVGGGCPAGSTCDQVIKGNPRFVDADGPDNIVGTRDDDLRLQARSPAVDAGDNGAVPADSLDLDGDGDIIEPIPLDRDGSPRFVDIPGRPDIGVGPPPIVDMGAYERQPPRPRAEDDAYSVDEDSVLAVTAAAGVLANDSPAGSLTALLVSGVGHGALNLYLDGSFVYTPGLDYNGPDSFTYRANDGRLDSNRATVIITVNPINDAPPVVIPTQQAVVVDEGQVATNSGLVSDIDGDSPTLTVSLGTLMDHGDGTWSWEFATNDGPSQSQTITLTADDGQGGVGQATFELIVNNLPPAVDAPTVSPSPSAEGVAVTASATFSDPGADDGPFTCRVNYGDGSGDEGGTLSG